MKWCMLLIVFFSLQNCQAQKKGIPLPNKYQLAWHENEFYLFMHFGPNSFTDREWGTGAEPAVIFSPQKLDCRQWCRIAIESGAKGIIITAKHHDGFCLWPSKYSSHTIRESTWKDGKVDVLKELSDACREAGIKFGVYLSPWDRNHPDYGTEKYNDVFTGMIKEVLSNYGPVWEMWWDGANGEGPNGKTQVYDWRRFENTARKTSPSTVIFSDIGPDIRWVGNESGVAGDPNWNFLDTAGFKRGIGAPPNDTLNHGNYRGKQWLPAECDVSIRPGWFWHQREDKQVKTAAQLFDLYLKSVGRGANLLLNVPPDSNGLIRGADIKALMDFKKLRDVSFKTDLLKTAKCYYRFGEQDKRSRGLGTAPIRNRPDFMIELPNEKTINCIVLKEDIQRGQTIRKFRIVLTGKNKKTWEIDGTSVGRKRILSFPSKKITSIHVYLEDELGSDNISSITAYFIDENLLEK